MAIRINKEIVERLSIEDKAELQRLLNKAETIMDKAKVLPQRECPICHKKYTPKSPTQLTCLNIHCRKVQQAQVARDRMFKERMKQLGKEVDTQLIGE
jgi:hypothetical protein